MQLSGEMEIFTQKMLNELTMATSNLLNTYSQPHICPVCLGVGQLRDGFYDFPGDDEVGYKPRCRTCDAWGIVWRKQDGGGKQ